jgi:hypothetical protein
MFGLIGLVIGVDKSCLSYLFFLFNEMTRSSPVFVQKKCKNLFGIKRLCCCCNNLFDLLML